ncbi:cytochrome P450 [Phenylobacterium montanum]|uniref:Cytochrome P450 n=1 Tax=Phenylobacterium montanum TaxID=2823693 RepID=A0A975G1M9_9CAUL|nr:cytochrome P450 [Caulobacter sp. S6]QUD89450.1 cytochrome P450 [Caulobacter sp. S6]
MPDGAIDLAQSLRDEAATIPLDRINPAQPRLFQADAILPYFERLRREDPVHFTADSDYDPYWSITRYNDIMAVDTNHIAFSSEAFLGGITIFGQGGPEALPMFIAMDPPRHDVQRKTVSPVVSPANLQVLGPIIRERAGLILDSLPIGEEFDWVDKVSVELTTMTLATLFDFPFEERRKLTWWSDVVTAVPGHGIVDTLEQKMAIFRECFAAFTELWNERVNAPPAGDLISMLAHGEATRNMDPREYHGNVILLIVGGNDTTRNTITGSVLALNQNPDQYQKLREHPELIPSMVSETIRWQTPLAHMRRTAVADTEVGGKLIRKGDKVIMWYLSGNRDEAVIENPDAYIIDRPRPRQHMSFGFGIHRCVGNRLAELQLTIVWEEILKRFPTIEVTGEPKRVYSTFVRGYERLPVVIPRRV